MSQLVDQNESKKKIVFDLSHGVGYYNLKKFIDAGLNNFVDVSMTNDVYCKPEDLNNNCGADYVQKKK